MNKKEKIKQLQEDNERIQGVLHECKIRLDILQHQLECDHIRWGMEYFVRNEFWGNHYFKECKRCGLTKEISNEQYNQYMRKKWQPLTAYPDMKPKSVKRRKS